MIQLYLHRPKFPVSSEIKITHLEFALSQIPNEIVIQITEGIKNYQKSLEQVIQLHLCTIIRNKSFRYNLSLKL